MNRIRFGVSVLGTAIVAFGACGEDAIAPNPDLIPPTVLSFAPLDGTTAVSLGASIQVVFSEPVVFVFGGTSAVSVSFEGRTLPGTLRMANPNTVAFDPLGAFDPGTVYSVSITTSITDSAGNALAEGQSWTFTTNGTRPPTVSQANLIDLIGMLSHDSMAGRGSTSADELRAAEYIRDQFELIGLDPAVAGYLQTFPISPDRVNGQIGVTSQNVLGVLPGEGDLVDQWVIVGAHYDHVGIRETSPGTDEIFNGADDNASGTAMVLELARVLQEYVEADGAGGAPRRSVMFQTYGAEEIGLLGSEHYCANPTTALSSVAGMLNFDMVGWLRNDDLYIGGQFTSVEWESLLRSRDPHQLDHIQLDGYLNSSDYACFRRNNVPTAWFFTGTHSEYHTPGDDVDLINGPGIKQIGDLAAATLVHLMLRPLPVPFDRSVP